MSAINHPFDCSKLTTALFWLTTATAAALSVLLTLAGGEPTRLLQVGSANPLVPQMRRDLGHVVTSQDAIGHDGQYNYFMARDPLGTGLITTAMTNGPRYRYRRILLPLLAGGFGQFSARWTLAALYALTAFGIGLATAATADLAFQWHVPRRAALAAMVNGGAFIGSVLLTSEPFALGLALTGLALFLRGRQVTGAVTLAAATLTKETYALVPLALAAWSWRNQRMTSTTWGLASLIPLALWSAWITTRFPGSSTAGNIGIPLVGVVQGIHAWITVETQTIESFLSILVIASLIGAVTVIVRRQGVIRYLLVPWLVLAMCSTLMVWGKANNLVRAFAILWPLAVLGLAAARVDAHLPRKTEVFLASQR
jgi:hypothetical protein